MKNYGTAPRPDSTTKVSYGGGEGEKPNSVAMDALGTSHYFFPATKEDLLGRSPGMQ